MKIWGAVGRGCEVVALAGAATMLIGVAPAVAVQDQPVLAGGLNTETQSTVIENGVQGNCAGPNTDAVDGCGITGVEGDGFSFGVVGEGPTGVLGTSSFTGVDGETQTGTGVLGNSSGVTGIGVEGQNNGSGSAVYGLAAANGVAVFGDTTNGTAVIARSTNGNALDVRGKATFSRSGLITVGAGSSGKTVTLAGVTKSSLVLATAQQDNAVYVRSAVPGNGQFTIHLTGPAPTGGLKVSYFVLN